MKLESLGNWEKASSHSDSCLCYNQKYSSAWAKANQGTDTREKHNVVQEKLTWDQRNPLPTQGLFDVAPLVITSPVFPVISHSLQIFSCVKGRILNSGGRHKTAPGYPAYIEYARVYYLFWQTFLETLLSVVSLYERH